MKQYVYICDSCGTHSQPIELVEGTVELGPSLSWEVYSGALLCPRCASIASAAMWRALRDDRRGENGTVNAPVGESTPVRPLWARDYRSI